MYYFYEQLESLNKYRCKNDFFQNRQFRNSCALVSLSLPKRQYAGAYSSTPTPTPSPMTLSETGASYEAVQRDTEIFEKVLKRYKICGNGIQRYLY